jgi:MFS family permease
MEEARRQESDSSAPTSGSGPATPSAWSPFRHATFAIIWAAGVVANIGSWMYTAASGWLMTSLNPDPLIVALVQVATTLPMFMFALPAGALADILDRRKFLIWLEAAATAISALFAAIVWAGLATPGNLLAFTFLIGVTAALTPGKRWCRNSCPNRILLRPLRPTASA